MSNHAEHYIELADGSKWYFDRSDNRISIDTIAHSLAGITRYTGHARRIDGRTYTVAEHSVKASWIDPTLETLMHDAAEAVVGDMSSPLKGYLRHLASVSGQLSDYDLIEKHVTTQIYDQHRIPDQTEDTKFADTLMAVIEARCILPTRGDDWGFITDELRECASIAIMEDPRIAPHGWSPDYAAIRFIRRFDQLRLAESDKRFGQPHYGHDHA